jgi:crossover junction endodeoxyribonuclease RusA
MIRFTVYGKPEPKGSTRSFQHAATGRVVTTADAKGLKLWAYTVRSAAQERAGVLLEGPVRLELGFFLTRPRSVSVRKRPYPTAKPDLDKLTRAVKDALTGVLWQDDAQVVLLIAQKVYTPGPSGVHVTVGTV